MPRLDTVLGLDSEQVEDKPGFSKEKVATTLLMVQMYVADKALSVWFSGAGNGCLNEQRSSGVNVINSFTFSFPASLLRDRFIIKIFKHSQSWRECPFPESTMTNTPYLLNLSYILIPPSFSALLLFCCSFGCSLLKQVLVIMSLHP